jgi:hypothetical protein
MAMKRGAGLSVKRAVAAREASMQLARKASGMVNSS